MVVLFFCSSDGTAKKWNNIAELVFAFSEGADAAKVSRKQFASMVDNVVGCLVQYSKTAGDVGPEIKVVEGSNAKVVKACFGDAKADKVILF